MIYLFLYTHLQRSLIFNDIHSRSVFPVVSQNRPAHPVSGFSDSQAAYRRTLN